MDSVLEAALEAGYVTTDVSRFTRLEGLQLRNLWMEEALEIGLRLPLPPSLRFLHLDYFELADVCLEVTSLRGSGQIACCIQQLVEP